MAEKTRRLLLRLPDSMHAALAALAERERRSLNSQILVLIQEALEARQPRDKRPH